MSDYLENRRNQKMFGKPPKKDKVYSIPKKSAKKLKEEAEAKEARGDDDTELQKFFKRAQKKMTGFCLETGLRTETKVYRYAIMSICHILPKRLCESVKYNDDNWVELAPDIHAKFDAISWEEKESWGCWPVVEQKIISLIPHLDPSEYRHLPPKIKDIVNDLLK